MESIYAVPGTAGLVEWLLAAVFYAFGWYRAKYGFNRLGDGLVVAGWVTSLAGVAWLAWDVSPSLALTRSSLAAGLGAAAVAVYAVLAHGRKERLSAILILALAIPAQAYAAGRLWWGVEIAPPEMFLPLWVTLGTLTGLVGYGALGVGVLVTFLDFAFSRARARLPEDQLPVAAGLLVLEWRSLQTALVALSISLLVELIRSWWGLGQVPVDDFAWGLITWLLLSAGMVGLMQDSIPRRPARAILVLAGTAAIIAVLTWTN